jgi:ParB family chromosome partitioning protein
MVAGPDPETVAPASVIDAPIIPSAPGILSAEEPLATTSSSQVDAAGQVRAHIVTSDQALCPVLAPADVLALPVHPAASHFPLLTGKRLDALVRDIKQRGVIDPVTVVRDDGQWFLLDGRNRREAAKILGITSLPFDVYPGTAPAEFVRSKNLRRRHLSLAERLAAAKALVAQVKQAKVARKVAAAGGNVATSDVTRGKTRDQLAADLGISARTAQDLLTVEAKATPELQQAVDDGVTPHVAAQVASLPPDQQRQAVNDARSKAGGSAKGLTRALGAAVKAVKKGGAPAGKRGSKASSGAAAAGSPKAAFGALQAEVGATPPAAIPVAWELVSTMKSTEGGACTGEGTIGGVALEFRFDMATRRLHVRPSSSRTEPHGG